MLATSAGAKLSRSDERAQKYVLCFIEGAPEIDLAVPDTRKSVFEFVKATFEYKAPAFARYLNGVHISFMKDIVGCFATRI
jgi:hypothetical protein